MGWWPKCAGPLPFGWQPKPISGRKVVRARYSSTQDFPGVSRFKGISLLIDPLKRTGSYPLNSRSRFFQVTRALQEGGSAAAGARIAVISIICFNFLHLFIIHLLYVFTMIYYTFLSLYIFILYVFTIIYVFVVAISNIWYYYYS